MKKLVLFFAFFSVLATTSAQSQMQQLADSLRRYRNIPGLVYAVFTTDNMIDSGVSGVRKMRVREPIRWNHRFQIGTTTTAFTSYIAEKLVQEGKISWNTTILRAFPEIDGKTMKLYHKLTLQQLLSQRAGLPPFEEYKEYREIHSMPGTPTQQRAAFVMMMLKKRPAVVMDSSQAVYSVAGTAIAAAMLERMSKKSWEQLVEQYVNKPLNIKAGFDFPALKDSTQPWGHWDNYFALTTHIDDYWARFFPAIAPAGNINISMPDYITFIKDHLLALQNQKSVIGTESATHLLYGTPDFATGWYNGKWRGLSVAYFLGRAGLFSSYAEIIKEKNIGIIVLCNSGTVDGRSCVLNLGRALREQYAKEAE
jgi:CubicO group peptidase (beta-lactamase class C family)